MAITTAKSLAAYIAHEYEKETKRKISPVRIQKTLYFCFAYWGGFVRKGKKYQDENRLEIDVSDLDEELFNDRIEAWVYGPVIPNVYHEKDIENNYDENFLKDKPEVKEFIDGVIKDTIDINDFKLVDISHCDSSWKRHFDYNADFHNEEITKEEIIEEYATK